jgi:uncharacterized protein Smg (DUF494 family)
MNGKIVDVIVWSLSNLKEDTLTRQTVNALVDKGFTDKEISTAFSWISEKLQTYEPNELIMQQVFPAKSFRIFNEIERSYFSKDSYSKLIQMLTIGLIRSEHIDMLLERAEYFGYKEITTDMINTFVASYVFDVPSLEYRGNRYTLTGYECIN